MNRLANNCFSEDEEWEISALLLNIGMPFRLSGYDYIRYSALLYNRMINNHYRVKITKDIYPVIAEMYGTNSKNVEHSIRHAINVVFSTGNLDFINKMFGYTVDPNKGKPTNGEFIAAAAHWISKNNFNKLVSSVN